MKRNQHGYCSPILIIEWALLVYSFAVIIGWLIFPAITGHAIGYETHTEGAYVISVKQSKTDWAGKPNYYIETSDGKIYQTTLTGIEPNQKYYLSVTNSGRIQKYDIAPNK